MGDSQMASEASRNPGPLAGERQPRASSILPCWRSLYRTSTRESARRLIAVAPNGGSLTHATIIDCAEMLAADRAVATLPTLLSRLHTHDPRFGGEGTAFGSPSGAYAGRSQWRKPISTPSEPPSSVTWGIRVLAGLGVQHTPPLAVGKALQKARSPCSRTFPHLHTLSVSNVVFHPCVEYLGTF